MGQCLGSELTEDEKNAKTQSADIDKDLYEHAKKEMNVVKILMLGAAESGKSTLVKQMKIIHSHGFTKQELASFKLAVLDNLLTSMKFVLYGMGVLRINLANSKNKIHAHSVTGGSLTCRSFFKPPHPFSFFENMDRIVSPDYLPTEMDVLRVRLRTTGVIETQFKVNHLIIRMYDVGGQRTERRKWISCFEDVRAVLFVVALSGYDMTLKEDPSMVTVCAVFSSDRPVLLQILFLNKIDLFQDKILHSGRHLRLYLPEFTGADCDVDAGARFIAGMFGAVNTVPDKLIYHHFTTATDTSNVEVVFQVVMDTIMKENLEAVSLL
uniref:Guanine nucleotide binding protein (G protein) alpha v1 n=1 Tax=Paramormyrops kingsleyae TaxID=1676925 RepID=A0A3B3SCJ5_9TELE